MQLNLNGYKLLIISCIDPRVFSSSDMFHPMISRTIISPQHNPPSSFIGDVQMVFSEGDAVEMMHLSLCPLNLFTLNLTSSSQSYARNVLDKHLFSFMAV